MERAGTITSPDELYLDLVIKCVSRHGFERGFRTHLPEKRFRAAVWRIAERALSRRGITLARISSYDVEMLREGRDWSDEAETMIGLKRLENIRDCATSVIEDDIPGDFIETGVWRGGACILMRAVLAAHAVSDRSVWLADSFRGLPPPSGAHAADDGDLHHTFKHLAISQRAVEENFDRYGLLDDQVRFLAGWFSETLPTAPIDRLALLRLDGDMYESTMDALTALYPKLSAGGYAIVDDFGCIPACKAAVTDYRAAHGITDEIETIDWTGVYWRKTG